MVLARANNQGAALEVLQIFDGTAGFLAQAEDAIAIFQKQMSSFSELGATTTPVEQGNGQRSL